MATKFPSVKAQDLQRVFERRPLLYVVTRQNGSHRELRAQGRPNLRFSYHDRATVPPGVVKKYLVDIIGLSEADALDLL